MLEVKGLKVGYENKEVIGNLDLKIQKGEVVSILGPNGCGKSTLLKTVSRILKPTQGTIQIDGQKMTNIPTKTLATKVAILSQHNESPAGITVKELVYYGRMPHKKWYETKNAEDEEIIAWALEETGLADYKDRMVSALSGGERQRVWLAMALAQKPEILLLDEPTTYLDISHQLELMELIREINKKFNMTVVMVLHDINQASEFSDRLVIMKQGHIMAEGKPEEVINETTMRDIYRIRCEIDQNPMTNKPRIHPICMYRECS